MKFTSVTLAFAVSGVYASTILERNLRDIRSVLDRVSSSIERLDTAARSFSGNSKPVEDKANELINTINAGKTTISGSSSLNLPDAISLQGPIKSLSHKSQDLADDFKAHRNTIKAANACSTVYNNLGRIKDASEGLVRSIISKIPPVAQGKANMLASDLIGILNQARNDFSPKNCKSSRAVFARDLQTIQGVLDKVSDGIVSLDGTIKSFSYNTKPIEDKTRELINTINTGKITVDSSGALTLDDASSLATSVQSLIKKSQILATDFKARRSDVEKANACFNTRNNLDQINSASKILIKSIVSKVPDDVQSIANELASGLTKVLSQARDDLSPENCKDGNRSSTAGGSSSALATCTQTSAATITTTAPTGGNNGTTPATAGAAVVVPAAGLAMAIAAAILW